MNLKKYDTFQQAAKAIEDRKYRIWKRTKKERDKISQRAMNALRKDYSSLFNMIDNSSGFNAYCRVTQNNIDLEVCYVNRCGGYYRDKVFIPVVLKEHVFRSGGEPLDTVDEAILSQDGEKISEDEVIHYIIKELRL